MSVQAAPFDSIAHDYARVWDESDMGRLQRNAAWRWLEPLAQRGDHVLDLGCGTGEDAVRFATRGVHVIGIDASMEMVRIARQRGVDAVHCRIEDVGQISGAFDGAFSQFGPLNCVADLSALRSPLSEKITPGGFLAICVMSRFCLWETAWYLLRGDLTRAFRRWKGVASSSLGMTVYYPRCAEIVAAFSPDFTLVQTAGIGICVPPSYVRSLPLELLRFLDRIDRHIAGWPLFAAMADHRIFIFRRATAK